VRKGQGRQRPWRIDSNRAIPGPSIDSTLYSSIWAFGGLLRRLAHHALLTWRCSGARPRQQARAGLLTLMLVAWARCWRGRRCRWHILDAVPAIRGTVHTQSAQLGYTMMPSALCSAALTPSCCQPTQAGAAAGLTCCMPKGPGPILPVATLELLAVAASAQGHLCLDARMHLPYQQRQLVVGVCAHAEARLPQHHAAGRGQAPAFLHSQPLRGPVGTQSGQAFVGSRNQAG
jgi:hypothetical protein